jgi:hypothetical protein
MVPRRLVEFTHGELNPAKHYLFDLQAVTHELTGRDLRGAFGPTEPLGAAFVARNASALPRVRLAGRPEYVGNEAEALAAVRRLGIGIRHRLVVEDPDRPLPVDAEVLGSAAITSEVPERVEVAVDAANDSYLVLADSYDPGWSATLDGSPAPVRAAWVAFRAVFVPRGRHTIVFHYRPAGFDRGLVLTALGALLALGCLLWPRPLRPLGAGHGPVDWPASWPRWGLLAFLLIVAASTLTLGPGSLGIQSRWDRSFHRFTWGAGIESMKPPPPEP